MSGNIKDTKVDVIKKEVYDLLSELDNGGGGVNLETKFAYLHKTSKSLFDFIVNNHSTLNKEKFIINLEMMLTKISSIQSDTITQHKASEHIGVHLYNQFKK